MRRILLCSLLFILALSGCANLTTSEKQSKEITISAAASLADAMGDIAKQFTKETGIKVNLNLGSSGSLEEQIEQGAPSDLFISASSDYTQKLVQKKLVDQKEIKNLLSNQLVLIVPKGSNHIQSIDDLKKAKRVAIGTPEIVPAGRYAKEALTSLQLWQPLESNLVYGKDVRQVLSYVETGNVDAGIVYKSDALISSKVKVISTISNNSHQPIIYPCAIIKSSDSLPAVLKMYRYLQSKDAGKVFKKYGFEPVKKE